MSARTPSNPPDDVIPGTSTQPSPLPGASDVPPLSSYPVVEVVELGWTPRMGPGSRRAQSQVAPVPLSSPPHSKQSHVQQHRHHHTNPHQYPHQLLAPPQHYTHPPQPPSQLAQHQQSHAHSHAHHQPCPKSESNPNLAMSQVSHGHDADLQHATPQHQLKVHNPQKLQSQQQGSLDVQTTSKWSPPLAQRTLGTPVGSSAPKGVTSQLASHQAPMTQAPAWLTGGYVHRAPLQAASVGGGGGINGAPSGTDSTSGGIAGTGGSQALSTAQSNETWCKLRLEAIAATVAGGDAVPELKRVMDRLEVVRFTKQRESLKKIRNDKWKATKRSRKAHMDLLKYQREMIKIDAQAAHIDAKIARLQSYSRFIEMGWREDKNEDVPANSSPRELIVPAAAKAEDLIMAPPPELEAGAPTQQQGLLADCNDDNKGHE